MTLVRVTSQSRGRTMTTVTIADVTDEHTDQYLTSVALTATRESMHRLFGTSVRRSPDDNGATVSLYTD